MGEFAPEAFTLLSIAVVVIIFRVIARWTTAGPKNFQLDDYLMPLAGVVYGLETGAAYCVGVWWKGLANNAMSDSQRAALDPLSEEYRLRVGGSKTQVIGWSLYTTLLWLLKSCMAVFYSRLTSGLVNMNLRVRIAYFLIAATYIAVICSVLFGCHPMHKNWQIHPDPGNYCQPAVSKIDVYVTVTLNVATDVYLISIPTPILFKARLPTREKLELLILFSLGFFVMAAGILRCVLIVTAGTNGASQAGFWACRETFVAIIINNAPIVYPFLRRVAKTAGLYVSSATRRGTKASQSYPLTDGDEMNLNLKQGKVKSGTGGSSMYSRGNKRRFRHPLSIPETQVQTTRWEGGSDEVVMLADGSVGNGNGSGNANANSGYGYGFGSAETTVTSRGAGRGEWERSRRSSESQDEGMGIKVVQETIIERR